MNFNRRQWIQAVGLAGFASCCGGCRFAPESGRHQWMFMTEHQELSWGAEVFEELVSREKASQNLPLVQLLSRVGKRIAEQANRADFDWEFELVDSETVNAVCLPGGKVVVSESILPLCENEAGLAVLLSHEVAHILARHGGERLSKGMLVNNAKDNWKSVTRANSTHKTDRMMMAYGVVSEKLETFPYSLSQELEADQIGVKLMANAGYDPNVATEFWKRLGRVNKQRTNEYSTVHVSNERRDMSLMACMGDAEQYYADCELKLGRGQAIVTPQT